MNLAKDVKDKKRGFCKNICSKMKAKKNVGLLFGGAGDLMPKYKKG